MWPAGIVTAAGGDVEERYRNVVAPPRPAPLDFWLEGNMQNGLMLDTPDFVNPPRFRSNRKRGPWGWVGGWLAASVPDVVDSRHWKPGQWVGKIGGMGGKRGKKQDGGN